MFRSLASIPQDHPSLFGEHLVVKPEPLIIEEDATILPRWFNINETKDWSLRFSQGVFNANGDHIEALSDQRGDRKLFFPPSRLEDANGYEPEKIKRLKFMLYGGTLYEHFGDMLVDTCRAYQLLRLYRHCKEPIWFHYAAPRSVREFRTPTIEAWLNCLGLANRFRLIRRPMRARRLVSCPQIYRDLKWISSDYAPAAKASLHPKLRRQLEGIERNGKRIAYLSRHKLTNGTSKFIQESQLVEQLRSIPGVDIICHEELNFEEKLSLWRSHTYIIGFPQGCLMLKPFAPRQQPDHIASQIFLLAGPKCFPSTWLNINSACQFDDLYLDCHGSDEITLNGQPGDQFSRANSIDVGIIISVITELAASLQ